MKCWRVQMTFPQFLVFLKPFWKKKSFIGFQRSTHRHPTALRSDIFQDFITLSHILLTRDKWIVPRCATTKLPGLPQRTFKLASLLGVDFQDLQALRLVGKSTLPISRAKVCNVWVRAHLVSVNSDLGLFSQVDWRWILNNSKALKSHIFFAIL